MPVGNRSRYALVKVGVAGDAAGAAHPTIPARWPDGRAPSSPPYFHTVVAGETIESLAARYLGSSQAWWMIADANPLVFPAALRPGVRLAIPTDASPGRVQRTRSF
jgi:Tfp pilus assembly protein FimV